MEKIILYGMGENFLDYKEYLSEKYTIAGVSDSNTEKNTKNKDFVSPDKIKDSSFDYIVVTASRFYEEIKEDLIQNHNIRSEQIISIREIMEVENEVIVVKIYGGMGNFLFQYALVKKLEFLYPDFSVKMDLSWYYSENMFLMSFQVPWIFERLFSETLNIASQKEILVAKTRGYYAEKEVSKFDENILKQGCGYYNGYWQTGRYFDDIGDSIREVLLNINEKAISYRQSKILEHIKSSESVAIWVRRGDYIANEDNRKMFGDICTEDYYENAIEYIRNQHPDAEFFVFSNDEEYAKEKYKGMNVITYNLDSQEFKEFNILLISQCKHIIGANSSMSWWASWIHGKGGTIIVPEKWNNTALCPDVYEDNWIKM